MDRHVDFSFCFSAELFDKSEFLRPLWHTRDPDLRFLTFPPVSEANISHSG